MGSLDELGALRRTPAGVPVLEGRLNHRSKQLEAGLEREVTVDLPWIALGDLALLISASAPDATVKASGFVAAKSLRSRTPVLHLTQIEFIEGNQHGFQTENQA